MPSPGEAESSLCSCGRAFFPSCFPKYGYLEHSSSVRLPIHQPRLILRHRLTAIPELYLLLGRSGCFANDKQAEKDAFIQGKSVETGVSFFYIGRDLS
jgi:hypothetical protein